MSFEYGQIESSCVKRIANFDRVVEFPISTMESGNISRVLSLVADAKPISVDAFDGYAEFVGRVNFKLLYIDREGMAKNLDYNADFNEKLQIDMTEGTSINAEICVLETDLSPGEEMKLSSIVQISLHGVEKNEMECLTMVPEDCYTEKTMMKVPIISASKMVDVDVSDEKSVGGDIEKILMTDSQVVMTDMRVSDGAVMMSGKYMATVCYMMDGEIKIDNFEIPFDEEVIADGVDMESKVCCYPSVKYTRIILTGMEGDNVLRVEGSVCMKMYAFDTKEEEAIKDLFMLTNEIETEKESCDVEAMVGCYCKDEKFVSSALLQDIRPAVRNIIGIAATSNNLASATMIDDGMARVEGVVIASILYMDENGYNSVKADLPYSIDMEVDAKMDSMLKVCGGVERATARAVHDREIEVMCRMQFEVEVWDKMSCNLVKNAVIGADKVMNNSAISVFIAKDGDSIWDVAKALTATPKDLKYQNPDMGDDLHDGDKVIYFRELNVEF